MTLNKSQIEALKTELKFLYGRINLEQKSLSYPGNYKLGTMRDLLSELGNPERDYRIVHVAGTKGKGSVSNMIAGGLSQSGLPTGSYNSPHLESIHERICFDGSNISDLELLQVLESVHAAVRNMDEKAGQAGTRRCSYFEIITAAALLHFSRVKAEWVVLEVGLGGRLDSTNVCQTDLCVITNVSIDHTRQLGSTVASIAREKAGIIKPGVPVISGALHSDAQTVIRQVAEQNDSRLFELEREFCLAKNEFVDAESGQTLCTRGHIEDLEYQIENIALRSLGDHQAINATIAIAALQWITASGTRIEERNIRKSLRKFQMNGRFEVISGNPNTVLDISHNVAAVGALQSTLSRVFPDVSASGRCLIFATSNDKDVEGMLNVLLPSFSKVVVTRYLNNRRAVDPQSLYQTALSVCQSKNLDLELHVAAGPIDAWNLASNFDEDCELLCITGSAFLVAELRATACGLSPAQSAAESSLIK